MVGRVEGLFGGAMDAPEVFALSGDDDGEAAAAVFSADGAVVEVPAVKEVGPPGNVINALTPLPFGQFPRRGGFTVKFPIESYSETLFVERCLGFFYTLIGEG